MLLYIHVLGIGDKSMTVVLGVGNDIICLLLLHDIICILSSTCDSNICRDSEGFSIEIFGVVHVLS